MTAGAIRSTAGRRLILSAGAAALALAAAAISSNAAPETQFPEPLKQSGPGQVSIGKGVEVGQSYSVGHLYVVNEGPSPVTLEDASLIAPPAGLDLVGVSVAPGESSSLGSDIGYPPRFPPPGLRPLAGATIEPGELTQIVIGFRVEMRGDFVTPGVSITYSTPDGHEWTSAFNATIRACAPPLDHDGDPVNCRAPLGPVAPAS